MTANENRFLTWENVENTLIVPGQPAMFRIIGQPQVMLCYSPGSPERLSLRIAVDEDEALPEFRFHALRLERIKMFGADFLEFSCVSRRAFQEAYGLFQDVTERVQVGGASPATALKDAIARFGELVRQASLLSEEEQVGLLGELMCMERLFPKFGSDLAEAWIAPLRRNHDFRLGDLELEVKTTRGDARIHRVHGEDQLEPSEGRTLWLISVQLQPAGAKNGVTLAEQIGRLRQLFAVHAVAATLFEELLAKAGWHDEDASAYPNRWELRSKPLIVLVNEHLPRITRPALVGVLGDDSPRITRVDYDINVDGLGCDSESPEYKRLFGRVIPLT